MLMLTNQAKVKDLCSSKLIRVTKPSSEFPVRHSCHRGSCVKCCWWKRKCEWMCSIGKWEGAVALHEGEVGVDLNVLKKNQSTPSPLPIKRAPHCFKQVC